MSQSVDNPSAGPLLLAQAGDGHAGTSAVTEAGHGKADHKPSLLSLEPGVAIWALVVFALLFFLLKKMAWGPMLQSIDEREKAIRDSLDKANEVQNESRRIAEEQAKVLSAAKVEANALIQGAKQSADELKRKITESAQEEKARILESAGREIEAAKAAAIADLQKSAGEMSISIAEKLIRQSLSDEAHRRLVDQLIDELPARR